VGIQARAVMKKALQVFLGLFGSTAIFIASLRVVLGPAAIPGSIPVNATMDSEGRFYTTMFAADGVALLGCIKDIERKSMVVYFLALTFFVGGLARLVFIAMTVLELLIPFVMAFMQSRVSKDRKCSPSANGLLCHLRLISPSPARPNRSADTANTLHGADHGVCAITRATDLFSTGGKQKPVLLQAIYVTCTVISSCVSCVSMAIGKRNVTGPSG
jgi:hypothetical protein